MTFRNSVFHRAALHLRRWFTADVREDLDLVRAELARQREAPKAVAEMMVYVWRALRRLGADSKATHAAAGMNPESAAISELGPTEADFLNFAFGPEGFASQAGLWMNPAVRVHHAPGAVRLAGVNERLVEIPYVLRALTGLAPGATVLDLGGTESVLALSLAAFGYGVTVVDPRPYPFAHPRLEVVADLFEAWDPGPRKFDAIVAVSTLARFGLGANRTPVGSPDADLLAMERLRGFAHPQTILLLTVPFGRTATTDSVQRTYDPPALDRLLAGWVVQDRAIFERVLPVVWVESTDGRVTGDRAVALVTARPA